MTAIWAHMRKDQVGFHQFWDLYCPNCEPILDVAMVSAQEGDDWAPAASQTVTVSSSNALGAKMFGFTHLRVSSQLLAQFVGDRMSEVKEGNTSTGWFGETFAEGLREGGAH